MTADPDPTAGATHSVAVRPCPGGTAAPRIRTVVVAALLTLGATAAVFGAFLALFLTVQPLRPHVLSGLAIALAVHALAIIGVLLALLRGSGIRLAALGFTRPGWRMLHLLWQVPATLMVLVLAQAVVMLLSDGAAPTREEGAVSDLAATTTVFALVGFLAIAVLTPFWEELFFRGILFSGVRARWGTTTAVAASSILFAAVHAIPLLMPYLTILGISACLLRLFHGNIWAPMVLHAVINAIAGSVILSAI